MKRIERPLLVALCVSAALLTIVVIFPLGIDDLIYRSMALDYYRFGKIPYLGSWDQNFPGIILIQYLSILLFGEHDVGLRFLDVLLQLGFVIIFYKFCRFWLSERAAAIAALLYVFYYVSGRSSLYSERDVYGVMAIVAGLYVALRWYEVRSNKGWISFTLAGLLVGYSIVIRPTFGLAYVLIAVFLLSLQKRENSSWIRWRPVVIYLIAGALPFAAMLVFYSTIPVGLQALYLSTIRFNLDVYTSLHDSTTLWDLCKGLFLRDFLVPLALIGMFAIRIKKIPLSVFRNESLLYWSLLLSFLFIALAQRTYLAYHFAPFYLLLCPLSAVGVNWILECVRSWFMRISVVLVAGFLFLFLMPNERQEIAGFTRSIVAGNDPWEAAYTKHHSSPLYGAVPEQEVLHYLSLPGNTAGSVEICSFEPSLREHLNRPMAGRYVLPTALALGIKDGTSSAPHFTDYQIKWRREYIDSLRSKQPLFIILARTTGYWNLYDPYLSYLHGLPGFDSLLQASYRYDTAFGGYQIFRRMK